MLIIMAYTNNVCVSEATTQKVVHFKALSLARKLLILVEIVITFVLYLYNQFIIIF